MGDPVVVESWHVPWALSGEALRLLTSLPMEEVERRMLAPIPTPIPVSERLPGPEDCVPHPRTKRGNWCWGFERCDVPLARPALWRVMHVESVELEASHWLPAHALPLPEAS